MHVLRKSKNMFLSCLLRQSSNINISQLTGNVSSMNIEGSRPKSRLSFS